MLLCQHRDISRQRAAEARETASRNMAVQREAQQRVVAQLGSFALGAHSLPDVLDRACAEMADLLGCPSVVALLLGAVAVAALNPIVAATSREYESRLDRLDGEVAALALSEDGLWLRQGGAGSPMVIRAERSNLDGTALSGVTFLSYGEDGRPRQRIEARSARLARGEWVLEEAKVWPLDAANPEAAARVERLTKRELPADTGFWREQAERLLAAYLWSEGAAPRVDQLRVADVSRADMDLAAALSRE